VPGNEGTGYKNKSRKMNLKLTVTLNTKKESLNNLQGRTVYQDRKSLTGKNSLSASENQVKLLSIIKKKIPGMKTKNFSI